MSEIVGEVEGGWDDPEDAPTLPDLKTSGDSWRWVPPWKEQNAYGARRAWVDGGTAWGEGRPPLTTRLKESLHPYELAHFTDETFRERLLDFTARVMLRRRVEGVEPEDMVQDVIVEMESVREREGFIVGSPDWMRVAQVVTRRRITDALRRMGGRKREDDERSRRRDALMYGEYVATRKSRPFESTDPEDDAIDQDPLTNLAGGGFVPQSFSDDFRELLDTVLTPRELEALTWTYEHDLSSDQAAQRMGVTSATVRVLVHTARESLSKQFSTNRR